MDVARGCDAILSCRVNTFFSRFLSRRVQMLTAVCVIFHVVGLVGIVAHIPAIAQATPLHLTLMLGLLAISFPEEWRRWVPWALLAGVASFAAEWVGVHTGLLFGDYAYGTTMGPRWDGIPLLIAANWVIVVSGAVSLAQGFAKNRVAIVVLAALFSAAMDWLLEPLAVRFGWWAWEGGVIPVFNYLCWIGLSLLLSALWVFKKVRAGSFAVILFLVQAMFFAVLRLLL